MKKIIFLLVVILFFSIGFFLRSQETISHNFLFLLDQGRDMMDIKKIIFDHKLTLIGPYTSLQGIFQGPLYYYLLAIPLVLTKGDPWGGVLVMLLISMSTLLLVYIGMKRFFGKKTALIALFLFAVCPEAVAAATYMWNPHPMWLLIVVYIFSFFQVIQKKRNYYFLLWTSIGVMFHFQTSFAVLLLITTIIYFLLFLRDEGKQKKLFLSIGSMLLFFLPQLLFDIRHNFLMTKSIFSLFSGDTRGLAVGGEKTSYLVTSIQHLKAFYENYQSGFNHQGFLENLPLIGLLFILSMLIITVKGNLLPKKQKSFVVLIMRIITIIVLVSFLFPFPIRYWYLSGFQSFTLLLLSVLLARLLDTRLGTIVVCFIGLTVFIINCLRITDIYFHNNDGGVAKIKGKEAALDAIYIDSQGKPFNLLIFAPYVYTDPYDYLIFWYGQKKYHYLPGKEKTGTFYLLIEPDPYKPWSYNGWLETVIKTGQIVYTKQLPSGHIIQKRIEKHEANQT